MGADRHPVSGGNRDRFQVVLNSNFGVFVRLPDDVEALVYLSEIDKEQPLP